MPGTLRTVPAAAATAALRDVVRELRGDDPLAPLTVVVPSALAGATLRRGLLPNGVAGIRFTSLPQYIDGVLTAAGESSARRTGARRRALVASALEGSEWSTGATTETLRLFDALLTELDEAELPAGEDLGAPDVLAVHRRYRDLLPEQERLAPADRAAALLPAGGEPVVLHLPRRLTRSEMRFCRALGARLDAVVASDADPAVPTALADFLTTVPATAASAEQQVEVSVDIDAEEEVRSAVRRVLEHVADPAHRLDRVAIAYRSAAPYARLVHEQLTAAGLPHHVPRQRSLAQSIAGSTLLALLALPDNGFSRPEMTLWWSSAPLLDLYGRRISATRWDRLSRDAGVTRGRQLWIRRLDEAAERAQQDLQSEETELRRDRVAQLQSLRSEIVALFDEYDAVAASTTWTQCADLCLAALDRHLGGVREVARWQPRDGAGRETSLPAERTAYDAVRSVLTSLGGLDGSQPFAGLIGFRQVLEGELARPLRESNGLARGVVVAPLSDLVGADLDLLLVLGMVEGSFPPRAREHPVLRDAARRRSNGALRTTDDRRGAERRAFDHGIASASRVVLSWPAADARSRRATHPAPWLLEHCEAPPTPLSFTQRTTKASTPLHDAEYDQQLLLRTGGGVRPDHPLAAHVVELAKGLAAVAERSSMTFGPWTGNVGPLEEVAVSSASGLQSYARCPHSFFLDKVLRVRDREEPDEEASPLDVGLVVHAALEEFFGRHLGRSPDDPWTPEEHADAHALLDRYAAALADQGKAGRPLVWETRTRQMHRSLRRTLLADDVWRREHRATPRGVEIGFGLDGAALPAIEVQLASGRTVSVRGSIDRVDEHEDGSLTVLDWKTGAKKKFDDLTAEPLDLVSGGKHLQLPLYAEAARQWHDQDVPVQAYYVLVDHGAERRGGRVDDHQDALLHTALETLTAGVAAGVFPVNPGEEEYFGWSHCGFCAFERLCPSSRGTQWEGVRQDPALVEYLQLTSPQKPEEAT